LIVNLHDICSHRAFIVNSTGDQSDVNVGAGGCNIGAAAAICALRAAIEELNVSTDASNAISFAIPSATDPGCDAATGLCVIRLT
jgi:CSLREA domain-containing protein